jgi:plasmid stabilization system protein ParE
MKYSLVFSSLAQQDVIEAIRWYNNQKQNLGFQFYDRLSEKLSAIRKNPLYYSIRFKKVRASKVAKHPFLIYFKIDEKNSVIAILAVLHTSRNPKEITKR